MVQTPDENLYYFVGVLAHGPDNSANACGLLDSLSLALCEAFWQAPDNQRSSARVSSLLGSMALENYRQRCGVPKEPDMRMQLITWAWKELMEYLYKGLVVLDEETQTYYLWRKKSNADILRNTSV